MTSLNKVILVVEDEMPLLGAIRLNLERHGFAVVTARTVNQAKDYVRELGKIDAVWLDHYLLGKDSGLDFVAWCREPDNLKCKLVPIFVVSNTATSDKVTSYMKLGADKYFVKSNHKLAEIIEEIKKTLHEK